MEWMERRKTGNNVRSSSDGMVLLKYNHNGTIQFQHFNSFQLIFRDKKPEGPEEGTCTREVIHTKIMKWKSKVRRRPCSLVNTMRKVSKR